MSQLYGVQLLHSQKKRLRFCLNLEDLYAEPTLMIKNNYKDNSISKEPIRFWYQYSKLDLESIECDPHVKKPPTSKHLTILNTCQLQLKKIDNLQCEN